MYQISGKNINGRTMVDYAVDKKEAEKKRKAWAKAGIQASVKKISG